MNDLSSTTFEDRKTFERLFGREVTDEEWEGYGPDEDEDLDEVAQQVRPRLAEYAFELAAVKGVGVISEAIGRDTRVQDEAKSARKLIFGSKEVPFDSLEAAWDWIWSEYDTEDGKRYQYVWERLYRRLMHVSGKFRLFGEQLNEHFHSGETSYRLTPDDRKLFGQLTNALDMNKLNPLVNRVYAKYRKKLRQIPYRYASWKVTELFMQGDSRILANVNQSILDSETKEALAWLAKDSYSEDDVVDSGEIRTYADWMQRIGMFGIPDDHVMLAYPGAHMAGENDACITACTEKLVLLAIYSLYLAQEKVRVWSQGQAAAYILTGKVPELPRFRIWVDKLPGGGKRAFIEITGSINFREMKEIYSTIREHTGTARKKSLRPSDVELIDFVEGNNSSWVKKLETWNHRHPERQFKETSGLINAFKAAKKRLTRP